MRWVKIALLALLVLLACFGSFTYGRHYEKNRYRSQLFDSLFNAVAGSRDAGQ